MLGLPLVPWPLELALAIALAVHWSFIGMAITGSAVLAVNLLHGREQNLRLNRHLVSFVIFGLSFGITFGILPLLMVQVLHGNFFYSANIVIAYWWLAVIPLLITGFYLLYYTRLRLHSERPPAFFLPLLALMVFATIASILVSETTVSQFPEVWKEFHWKWRGLLPYWGAFFIPRWIFAFGGLLAMGGIMVSVLSKITMRSERQLQELAISQALRITTGALFLQVAGAVWLVLALPAEQQSVLLGKWPNVLAFYSAAASFLIAAILVQVARRRMTAAAVIAPAVIYYAGLFAAAMARDKGREVAMSRFFDLSTVAAHPQWAAFIVFLGTIAIGVGMVAYMVHLAVAYRGREE